jgi:hypothetical protein
MKRFLANFALVAGAFLVLHVSAMLVIHFASAVLHDEICAWKAPVFARQDTATVILSGSSTLTVNVIPDSMRKALNMPVISIAKPANSPARNHNALRKLIRPGDIVIQSFDPWIYLTQYSAVHDERMVTLSLRDKLRLHEHPIRSFGLFSQVKSHYTTVLSLLFHRLKPQKAIASNPHHCLDQAYEPSPRLASCFEGPRVDSKQLEHLREIHELCEEHGATLLVTYPPKSSKYFAASQQAEALVSEAMDVFQMPAPTQYDLTFLADDFHLNCQGRSMYTNHLISRVRASRTLN